MAPSGTLFLVATPIGHPDDLTPRACAVLGQVALVAAEDTRRAGLLLQRLGLSKPLVSCFEHNERSRIERVLGVLAAGEDVALVSDAGSPGISDPGYPTVRAAVAQGAPVTALPGPCAAVLALQVSGLPTDRFCFLGFPPKKGERRRAFLREALGAPGTVICYVPARDTAEVLDDLCALASQPPAAAVARELTKRYEEVLRGPADELRDLIRARKAGSEGDRPWKGEVTLVFSPAETPVGGDWTDSALEALLRDALAEGEGRSAALRKVREQTGVRRARLYALQERLKGGPPPSRTT